MKATIKSMTMASMIVVSSGLWAAPPEVQDNDWKISTQVLPVCKIQGLADVSLPDIKEGESKAASESYDVFCTKTANNDARKFKLKVACDNAGNALAGGFLLENDLGNESSIAFDLKASDSSEAEEVLTHGSYGNVEFTSEPFGSQASDQQKFDITTAIASEVLEGGYSTTCNVYVQGQ